MEVRVTAEILRDIIEAERLRAGVPGCAVVVVRRGDVVFIDGFGRRHVGNDLPVTPQTLFPIGSSTKTFTAALLAGLDLDAPIRSYLPDFALLDPVASEHVSIRDCLSHRTGLPRHDILWQAGDGVINRRDLIDALAYLPANKRFREAYQYNNLLYIVAGEIAGQLQAGTYEEAVAQRILQPLAMARTNFSVDETKRDPDHAKPYLRAADDELHEIPFARLDLAGPAGGLNSTASDLVPWLLTLTGHGVEGRGPLLSNGILDQMRTPAIDMPADSSGAITAIGYGLGQMLETYRGHHVAHHGGNIDGFSSQILTRDDGIGIALLSNLHATSFRDSLPYYLLDAIDGVPSPDHGSYFRDRLKARFAAADAARALRAPESPAPPSRPLADYAGRYQHPGYGEIVVDRSLAWSYRGLSGAMHHHHAEVFEAVTTLNGAEVGLPAEFTPDALHMRLELMVPPIRFARCATIRQ